MKRESKKAPKVIEFPNEPIIYSPGTQVNQPINMKTSGVETRGNGAATKGTKARGPMA
jgi:hypothetical protein|tara:strand:+ start:271 stop:444 length:174 start_codon:yes stop_codon:yes gene_type:complete